MASLSDLFEDFSRLKEFSEDQVVELVGSFRQINKKLSEDLPSGLEGYAEFLKDKGLGGSGSKVEQLIKSSISSECEKIVTSDAYKFMCAYISEGLRKDRERFDQEREREEQKDEARTASFKEEDNDPFDILRIAFNMDHFSRNKFRRPFSLPWLSLAAGTENQRRRPFVLWGLFGRIQTNFKVTHYDSLEKFLPSQKSQGKSTSKTTPTITFFEDDYGIRILEALLKNEFSENSRSAIRCG